MKQKRQARASKNCWSSNAAEKSGFTSTSAVKVSLELDQPGPGEPIDWEGHLRADGEQGIGGCQCFGSGKTRELLGAYLCQRRPGAPPLSHPFALEPREGRHEIYYLPPGCIHHRWGVASPG